MEADSTFVRANGIVELNPVTRVGLDFAIIVNPSNPKLKDAVGLGNALDDFVRIVLWVFVYKVHNGFQYFFYSLEKFFLTWVFLLKVIHYPFEVHF
jgi:hypothetical protein